MGPAATYAIRDGGIPIYPEYKGIKCVCVKLKKKLFDHIMQHTGS